VKDKQLHHIKMLLRKLAEKAQQDEKLFPYIACACGAQDALEEIEEKYWDDLDNVRYKYSSELISAVISRDRTHDDFRKWELCFHLNDANVRVDALRDRIKYYYKIEREDGFLTNVLEIREVYRDVLSFKHMEYEKPKGKKPHPSERVSSPSNTANALELILTALLDKDFFQQLYTLLISGMTVLEEYKKTPHDPSPS